MNGRMGSEDRSWKRLKRNLSGGTSGVDSSVEKM